MNKKNAFTIIELLVVISIIAVLAAVIMPNAFKSIEKSKVTAFTSDADAMEKAMYMYYADTGEYPDYIYYGTSEDTFKWIGQSFFISGSTSGKPADVIISIPSTWDGPYLDRWPDKTPFGGYYTIFDYGSLKDNSALMSGIKKYVNSSETFWTEYGGKRVVAVEIGFGLDKASRDKALDILIKRFDEDRIYYQDYNDSYFNIIIPTLIE